MHKDIASINSNMIDEVRPNIVRLEVFYKLMLHDCVFRYRGYRLSVLAVEHTTPPNQSNLKSGIKRSRMDWWRQEEMK